MIFLFFILRSKSFQSLILGLWSKIINSVVVLGLYYGFLTIFSIGPSYILILRARVMEEGTEREVAATTGFLVGQLMMFISIYYPPLYLALGRPYTITFLGLPYLFLNFFWYDDDYDHYDYGFTTRNLMRDLSIQCVFLNNLIFQLLNHYLLPSSALTRLVNIYMFRCNNKMLFLTSSFVGWLIGFILFRKWVGLVLFWIRQYHYFRYKGNRYRLLELRESMDGFFSILLFITCVYYLGRAPSPIFTRELNDKTIPKSKTEETEEGGEDEFNFQRAHYKDSPVYNIDPYKYSNPEWERLKEEEENSYSSLWFENTFITFLFDYQKWYHPLRYINNFHLENALRNEMSQFFFSTCPSDGKQRISFTYPPSLSTFSEILEQRSLDIREKLDEEDLYNSWIYTNERKKCNLNNELRSRIQILEKNEGSPNLDILEKRAILSDDISEIKCLPKAYDPFCDGIYRGTIKKFDSWEIMNNLFTYTYTDIKDTDTEDTESLAETFRVNKIHDRFLKDHFNAALEIHRQLFPNSIEDLRQINIQEIQEINEIDIQEIQEIQEINEIDIQEIQEIQEINKVNKKVPRWSHRLSDDLAEKEDEEEDKDENEDEDEDEYEYEDDDDVEDSDERKVKREDADIYPRRSTQVIIYKDTEKNKNKNKDPVSNQNIKDTSQNDNPAQIKEVKLPVQREEVRLPVKKEEVKLPVKKEEVKLPVKKEEVKLPVKKEGEEVELPVQMEEEEVELPVKMEEVELINYFEQPDFRRNLIKGTIRAQRRKTIIGGLFQVNVHSMFFLDRTDYLSFVDVINGIKNRLFRNCKILFGNWMGRKRESEWKISDFESKSISIAEEMGKEIKDLKQVEAEERMAIIEAWEDFQYVRSVMVLTQSFIRKYITLPSFIIAKNLFRIFLFQWPEWYEDFKQWKREVHVPCGCTGVPLSEKEFPDDWLIEGIQIKIINPFPIRPWQKSRVRSHHKDPKEKHHRDPMEKKDKKEKRKNYSFLTVWGEETEFPFGHPRRQPSFFKPIYKELIKRYRKGQKYFVKVLNFLKEKSFLFIKVIKEVIKETIKRVRVRVIKPIKEKLEKLTRILLWKLMKQKIHEPNENEKDFKNDIIRESSVLMDDDSLMERRYSLMELMERKYSLMERRTKDLSDKTIQIRNQIERNRKDKKKKERVLDNKKSKSQKHLWKIFQRKNIRFMRKSHYFFKSLIEKIYIDILLCTISKINANAQLFFESKKKIFHKYIYNNERNQEEVIDERNPKTMNLILTIKNKNGFSNTDWTLSSLSQAYVFYKLSQTQLLNQLPNKYHFRLVLQYKGRYPFFKDKLKDSLMIHGIFDFKARHKKYVINEWKNWLKGHYQYDLSKKNWSRLIPQKWRNRIHQRRMIQNKESIQADLYKYTKDQFIHEMNDYAANSFMSQKDKWKKHYRYDRLSYGYISSPNSYISESTLVRNGGQQIPCHFNTSKLESFDVLVNISNLEKGYRIDRNTNLDQKYFDYRILHFAFTNRIDIEIWFNTHIGVNQTTNQKMKNFPKIEMEDKSTTIYQESLYDIYDTASNHDTISNLESWFFPELVILFNVYRIQPWVIPIQSLFFNFHIKQESQNGNVNPNKKILISYEKSNKEKDLELGNSKHEKHKKKGQENLDLNVSNKKKSQENLEENLDSNVSRKQKKYNGRRVLELYDFLKQYLLLKFVGSESLDQDLMSNIDSYCLLLGMKDQKGVTIQGITISSIRKGQLNLDEMLIQNNLFIQELIGKGIWVFEPMSLSIRRDGKSILYQILHISLVDKMKQQTNRKYTKKRYYDYDFLIPENILSPRRRREFRIRTCLNSRNCNVLDRNPRFCNKNKIRNCGQFWNGYKHINTDTKNLRKFKLFLWPHYRLEDLACMNRYWFDTNNSSRFSMLRIHMYSQFRENSIPFQ